MTLSASFFKLGCHHLIMLDKAKAFDMIWVRLLISFCLGGRGGGYVCEFVTGMYIQG